MFPEMQATWPDGALGQGKIGLVEPPYGRALGDVLDDLQPRVVLAFGEEQGYQALLDESQNDLAAAWASRWS